MKRASLRQMRLLAKRRGGNCVSKRYFNSRIPLRWRCRFGHRWKAMPTNVSKGSWCPKCAHRQRLTIGEMRALAVHRGGECISDQYVNNETKLLWRCAAGHEWEATPQGVRRGAWCPCCAHVARLSLSEVAAIAASHGGRCLSAEYVNVHSPLVWECEAGHRWTATPASVRQGTWCSVCVQNRRLKIEEMQRVARARGGKCLSERYLNNRHTLMWECKRGHRWRASPYNVRGGKRKRGTWCPKCYNLRRKFNPRRTSNEMKALARSRGGLCLSEEYVNSKSKLFWRCDKEHRWRASPVAVRSGSWCPVCARNQRLTLQEFRSIARGKGGRCLSRRYINKDSPLKWKCAVGHRWRAAPRGVKRGRWCPKCASLKRRSPWREIATHAAKLTRGAGSATKVQVAA